MNLHEILSWVLTAGLAVVAWAKHHKAQIQAMATVAAKGIDPATTDADLQAAAQAAAQAAFPWLSAWEAAGLADAVVAAHKKFGGAK
jgi:hypothetical protein